MNFPVTNTQHDHPDQKVLEHFAQLKKTCRLYDLSFCHCLMGRLTGSGTFPELADLIPLKAPGLSSSGSQA